MTFAIDLPIYMGKYMPNLTPKRKGNEQPNYLGRGLQDMHPEEIKAALRIKGVTQAMLADELEVAPSSIHQTITGRIQSERIQKRISKIIGKPIAQIWIKQISLRRSRTEIEAQRAQLS